MVAAIERATNLDTVTWSSPGGPARTATAIGAVGAAVEVFAWMTKHPSHPLAKALARPGHELQHRIATAEPSPEQLEVAEAALAACLELEDGDRAAA